MRILFVDDEARILDGLRRMLWSRRNEWTMEFATGGAAALAALRAAPFDVVVTDMRMPEMDGAALLEVVNHEWPATARVVLSGQTEHAAAERAARVAHQFVSKPCEPAELASTLARLASDHRLVPDHAVRHVLGHVLTVPSPPVVYGELARALGEAAPLSRVAALVRRDPGLTATVLRLVDTTFFGRGGTSPRMESALGTLGPGPLRSVVLAGQSANAQAVAAIGDALSLDDEARHARLTAAVARALAPPGIDPHVASKAGLLYNVGRLVSAAFLQSYPGVPHGDVGGYLLGLWGLRRDVVAAVAHRDQPDRADDADAALVATVHVADVLAVGLSGVRRTPASPEIHPWCVERIGGAHLLPVWRAKASAAAADLTAAA
jgi:DNA-binding NarL/FixJ family response regulator